MPLPEHSKGSTPTVRDRSPVKRAPGRLNYVQSARAGFEFVPDELVPQLYGSGVLSGEMWVGSAEPPVARRRRDGSHFQHVAAWWASDERFVQFDATRELTMTADGKLRPRSSWGARGSIREFRKPVAPARATWRYEVEPSSPSGGRPRRPKTKDPLDVLPRAVTGQFAGGSSDAWMKSGRGWAIEEIVAYRVDDDDGHVYLLRAQREATSERALESADWVTEAADARCGAALPFSIGGMEKALSTPPSSRGHLP